MEVYLLLFIFIILFVYSLEPNHTVILNSRTEIFI